MESLVDTVDNLREETLALHTSTAFAELKAYIKSEPLKTKFFIYAGCISKDVATEIAHRFTVGNGYIATVCTKTLSSTVYLEITIPLSKNLIHEETIPEVVISETNPNVTNS